MPLAKPGKNPQILSYRPIALTASIGKIMERMEKGNRRTKRKAMGWLSFYTQGASKRLQRVLQEI